jgi:4-oxalocrotonate tautomerase
MPIVQITLVEGRDDASIKDCIREVARAVHRTLNAPLETIRVVVTQVPGQHFGVGERTRDEIDLARQDAPAKGKPA